MKHLIILGKPCSGKGTISKEYEEKGYHHLSGSDMLRDHIKDPNAKYYNEAKYSLDNGEMINDDIINGIFFETVKLIDPKQPIIFDGFPRSIGQANAVIEFAGINHLQCMLLDVDNETCIDRLTNRLTCKSCAASFSKSGENQPTKKNTCNYCHSDLYVRPDDNVEIFESKIKEYDSKTKPIIEHLQEQGIQCVRKIHS
jgi:adenylate kinase